MTNIIEFIPEELFELAELFPKEAPLYIVGGFIRDVIEFNKQSNDIDLSCALMPEELIALLSKSRFKVSEASLRLGTMIIKGNNAYEYTTFRVDSYPNGIGVHAPQEVIFTNDIEIDASRRDFKCNAVYFDIKNKKIIDPLNGIEDIEMQKLSTTIDPNVVLSQDGLRIMRLARMVSVSGYSVENKTLVAAKALVSRLKDISAERIQVELVKILKGDHCYNALHLMKELGVLNVILPELMLEDGLQQNPKYHKYDVLEHTFKTVEVSPKKIRLAALFHDIGKPVCVKRDGNMHLHNIVGVEITKDIMSKYKFSKEEIEFTTTLVEAHMFDVADNAKENTIRKFIIKYYRYIEDIIDLQTADAIGTGLVCGPLRNSRTRDQLIIMKERKIPFSIKELKITGNDLIKIGFKGEMIGKMLNEMMEACMTESIKNERESLISYAERKRRKMYGDNNINI